MKACGAEFLGTFWLVLYVIASGAAGFALLGAELYRVIGEDDR